jgi:hypothetical protein
MKKTFLTSAFILSVLFSSAQTDTLRTKGRKSIPTVIGKWQLDSINGSTKKMSMPHTIEFLTTGDYTETIMDVPKNGKWKMENGAIMREERSNPIENLTMKKMVLSETENKKKVLFYFSRMNYAAPRQDVIPH